MGLREIYGQEKLWGIGGTRGIGGVGVNKHCAEYSSHVICYLAGGQPASQSDDAMTGPRREILSGLIYIPFPCSTSDYSIAICGLSSRLEYQFKTSSLINDLYSHRNGSHAGPRRCTSCIIWSLVY